jgi:hypothetical protein
LRQLEESSNDGFGFVASMLVLWIRDLHGTLSFFYSLFEEELLLIMRLSVGYDRILPWFYCLEIDTHIYWCGPGLTPAFSLGLLITPLSLVMTNSVAARARVASVENRKNWIDPNPVVSARARRKPHTIPEITVSVQNVA